jgi:MerR family transcriptional regulator, copper efflux regulator
MLSEPISRQLLRVGDLARMTGKSVRAIHLYEELGLLQPARRTSGGFRLFETSATERVRWIDLLHHMGFSLQDMRELVKDWWSADLGPEAMEELRVLFERKLAETREAIQRHQQLEKELSEGIAYLKTCCECGSPAAVDGCVNCTQDHGMHEEPALVAGITTAPDAAKKRRRPAFVKIEDIE